MHPANLCWRLWCIRLLNTCPVPGALAGSGIRLNLHLPPAMQQAGHPPLHLTFAITFAHYLPFVPSSPFKLPQHPFLVGGKI